MNPDRPGSAPQPERVDQDHDHGHSHAHPPHLAHHFETPEQQMESGKLGMWVFLATEILMFGGLFCAYAVYRANHPEVFLFAHQFLDTNMGAINTAILLASSFTMAWGVRAAQLGQQRLLVGLLSVTLLGGLGFMAIKTIEYSGKADHGLWVGPVNAFYQVGGSLTNEENFQEAEHYLDGKKAKKYGKAEYHGHDMTHDGMPGGEHAVHGTEHAAESSHLPPDGHTPDNRVANENQTDPPTVAEASAAVPHERIALTGPDGGIVVPVSTVAPPASPTAGLIPDMVDLSRPQLSIGQAMITGPGRVQATHAGSHYPEYEELGARDKQTTSTFFQIYYVMTGLHGIHVIVGMALIGWITWLAGGPLTKALVGPIAALVLAGYFVFFGSLNGFDTWLWVSIGVSVLAAGVGGGLNLAKLGSFAEGTFSPAYYTPVDLVGLYWHLVDLIWIFLFPLLYLIH
jgi:cytochrome c oxidase subunit 3